MSQYEVYCEKFEITQWKGDAIYRTQSLGTGWFDESVVNTNRPRDTGVMFAAAFDEFAQSNPTTRKKPS